jgi:hypothetical protein
MEKVDVTQQHEEVSDGGKFNKKKNRTEKMLERENMKDRRSKRVDREKG